MDLPVAKPNNGLIDGESLTVGQLAVLSRSPAPIRLSSSARTRIAQAHETAVATSARRPVYGQNTGVGSKRSVLVPPEERDRQAMKLLRSHAATAGPAVPEVLARAMMIVRLNQIAAGGSGVSTEIAIALTSAINAGLTPPIKKYGAIGTGDLGALATTAMCLAGEIAWNGGEQAPISFTSSDALGFISSGAATIAEAVLACNDLQTRLDTAQYVAALSHLGMAGSLEPYHPAVHSGQRPNAQRRVAKHMLDLLEGHSVSAARVQDPYGLRAFPQVHGPAWDALAAAVNILTVDMNGSSENPLISYPDNDIFHNGNFHTANLALALDTLRAALFQTASLSVARTCDLMLTSLTGLKPHLASGTAASSGVHILEYVAQSALADIRHLAYPVTLAVAVLDRGAEQHASFAPQAAWNTTSAISPYDTVLACELITAVRALRHKKPALKDGPLRSFLESASRVLDPRLPDRSLVTDIESAELFIRSKSLT